MENLNLYPFFLKNVILPTMSHISQYKIWKDYKVGLKTEELGFEELRKYQFSRLKEILIYADEKVPFYRERFAETGFQPEQLVDDSKVLPIPPTTKEDIMSNFPERITAEDSDKNGWKYVATSGTTRKVMGIHDFSKTNIDWAAGMRAHKLAGDHNIGMRWMEIPPHMCTNICGINDTKRQIPLFSKHLFNMARNFDIKGVGKHIGQYAHGRRHDIYRRITLPSFGSVGTNIPDQDIEAYIRSIKDYRPYLLEGLPLYLYTLAKYIIKNDIAPPPVKVIKPFGGSMTKKMKQVIRKGFNCEVYDTYGCSEMGFIASDCTKHDGLHLFMDLYYVEVCRSGELVEPGELGKLYITDLTNRAMPWIRYDIGDVGRYFVEDHNCGRKAIRIEVEGRLQDSIINTNGEIFTSDRVFDFFNEFEEIDNFQLIERSSGSFDLLCVPTNGSLPDKDFLNLSFNKFIDENRTLRTYRVNSIKAEDGGKFRFVKSKSYDQI